ncbi:unnamed protein product [Staurois parvus]|uniref:Uncharacterized protein n=1 Tax=Staurois parvus TaxID=386267 RepID=A0ABN9HTI4_9NEOB|nr:unnamed protein product [Staurois parvus]
MQLPVLGCTFLTLSEREESTAENRQLSEQGTDDQCPDDRCPAVHPPVPPTCVQQCCPPVPSSATHLCHPPVTSSATHL